MIGVIPERIAPDQLLAAGARLEGRVALAQLGRLYELLQGCQPVDKDAHVQLSLTINADGLYWLQGKVQARLRLRCERCQEMMEWPVDASISVYLVANEALAAELADDVDYIIASDSLELYGLVEDEIILALPLVARHPQGTECGDQPRKGPFAESGERDSPFAILKTLKT